MENEAEVIELLEEGENLPDQSEVETGQLGILPENAQQDSFARHFIASHKGRLLGVHDLAKDGGFAVFNDSRWILSTTTRCYAGLVADYCQRMSREMPPPPPEDGKKRDYRLRFLDTAYQEGVVRTVAALLGRKGQYNVSRRSFDSDGDYLCVAPRTVNGETVGQYANLRTGEICDMTPEMRFTKRAPFAPDREGSALFRKVLLDVMSGEQDRADCLLRCLGSSIFGTIREQLWFLAASEPDAHLSVRGRNGKDTVFEAVQFCLGDDYADGLNPDQILYSKNTTSDQRRVFGQIRGKRFLCTGELNATPGRTLNTGLVKMLTGGNSASAAEIYERAQRVQPTWHLWSNMNFMPTLERTGAMRDRIVFFEFRERFHSRKRTH